MKCCEHVSEIIMRLESGPISDRVRRSKIRSLLLTNLVGDEWQNEMLAAMSSGMDPVRYAGAFEEGATSGR